MKSNINNKVSKTFKSNNREKKIKIVGDHQ